MADGCTWIVGKGGATCNAVTLDGGEHCYFHKQLARIGLQQDRYPDPVGAQDLIVSDQRKKWKRELDQDFTATKKEIKRGKGKTLHAKASDFPCLIDGLMFNSIEEYLEFTADGGMKFLEMPGTDQQYDELTRNPGKFHGKSEQRRLPLFGGGSQYTPPPPKPEYTLKLNHYAVLDTVEHMSYVVFRTEAGDYFALWISLQDFTIETTMSCIASMNLKELTGQVVELEGARFHSKGAYKTYGGADGNFYRGGETPGRIRERIRKAKDPNYLPPNLRQLALLAFETPVLWSRIPVTEHERLKAWLNDGAPGWWKGTPKGVRKGCMDRREQQATKPLALPPAPKDKQAKPPTTMAGQVWDALLKMWVKKTN